MSSARPKRRTRRGWIAGITAAGLVIAGLTVGGAPAPASAAGTLSESVIWTKTEASVPGRTSAANVINHTLPAVLATPGGDVLAFTEARVKFGSDDTPHDIVYKRSTDGGVTWGANTVLERANLDPAHPDDVTESWVNPTLVADADSGRIVVFYGLNHASVSGDVFYRYSDDDGVTWSARTDVTGLWAGNTHGWTFHIPGPGHGIQLADGTLLMQVWHRKDAALPTADRDYGVSFVGSDDGGLTWTALGEVPVSDAFPIQESRVVQLTDGSLLVNGRQLGARPRVESRSTDGGLTWSAPVAATQIDTFTSVDAPLTRFSGGVGSTDVSRLLFARPDSTVDRQNMTVSLSYDDGATYPIEKVLYSGMSHYSDLTPLPDGTALLIYGKDGTASSRGLTITAAKFDLEWLSDGRDSLATGPIAKVEVGPSTVGATSGDPKVVVTDANASGGNYQQYSASGIGDYIDVNIPIVAAGTYDLTMTGKQATNRGIVQASVGGVNIGSPYDLYHATDRSFVPRSLGSYTVTTPGTLTVRFTVTGKNTASTGYYVFLDTLTAQLH